MSPKRRTIVKMFMPELAPKVKDGTKRQTIRPKPKRSKDIPRVGDLFSGRQWEGQAYASKQIRLREGEITEVQEVTISEAGISLDRPAESLEAFAKADGFADWADMREWFRAQYGLPWSGILIRWKPDPA